MSILKAILSTWSSRKLWMTLIVASILWAAYHITARWIWIYATGSEQDIPHAVEAITALTVIYQVFFYALAGMLASYLGATGMVEMRQGSVVQTAIEAVSRKIDKTENVKMEITNEGRI